MTLCDFGSTSRALCQPLVPFLHKDLYFLELRTQKHIILQEQVFLRGFTIAKSTFLSDRALWELVCYAKELSRASHVDETGFLWFLVT